MQAANKIGYAVAGVTMVSGMGLTIKMMIAQDKYHSTKNRLDGKTFVVTGGTSGIGKRVVQNLTLKHGAKVVVPTRDLEKCQKLVQENREEYENLKNPNFIERMLRKEENYTAPSEGSIECKLCDLKNFKSVAEFAKSIPKVDGLVNNAGVFKPEPTTTTKKTLVAKNDKGEDVVVDTLYFKTAETDDHLEETLQVNALSHYLLTKFLKEKLENSSLDPEVSRVVNITCASQQQGLLNFQDLNKTATNEIDEAKYDYRGLELYKASKLANVLLSKEMAKNWPDLVVTCLDPGVATDTDLGRNISNTQGLTSYANKYINPGYYLYKVFSRTANQCAGDIAARFFEESENGGFYRHNEKALNLARVDEVVDRQNERFRQILEEKGQPCTDEDLLRERRAFFSGKLDLGIYSNGYSKVLWKYSDLVTSQALQN